MKNNLSSASYEEYMKDQLSLVSPKIVVKAYKTANEDEWGGFVRGTDLRIQIQLKKKSLFEFVVEKSFWYQRNNNKDDRKYMRDWADKKVQMFESCRVKKKEENEKSS
tara:strand:- start:190 stop:513 length:324 start_codon:yes stop_codon:yes gene_type:complete